MSSKKKNTANTNLPALRIGSRVRFRDDGVEGRISWANAVSVKIKWDDGEEVTWRRDALAGKPIDILDAENDQAEAPTVSEETVPPEPPQMEPEPPPASAEGGGAAEIPWAEPLSPAEEQTPIAAELPVAEPAPPAQQLPQAVAADSGSEPMPAVVAKPKRQRKAPTEPKEKKVSALDAAARVLAEENRPMTCQEMIDSMAAKGYWASPKGATPAATLYSAILRELITKGAAARFAKTDRGKFARNAGA